MGTPAILHGPEPSTGIELFHRADGSLGAVLVSPDQDPIELPVDRVPTVNGEIRLSMPSVGIDFHPAARRRRPDRPSAARAAGRATEGSVARCRPMDAILEPPGYAGRDESRVGRHRRGRMKDVSGQATHTDQATSRAARTRQRK